MALMRMFVIAKIQCLGLLVQKWGGRKWILKILNANKQHSLHKRFLHPCLWGLPTR